MMAIHCERLDREVMIWTGQVAGIDNTEHGIVVTYQCACGEMGQVLTGAGAAREVSAHVPA